MKLNNQDIAVTMEKIEKFFEKVGVSEKDKLRICFLFEETLLRYRDNFGAEHNFEIITKKWFGTPKILIKIKGKPYNPIEDNSDEQIFSEIVMNNLLNYENEKIIYRYENGCNEISAISTIKAKKIKIPGGNTTVAIFFAIISALIVQNFSEPTQKIFVENFVTPVLDRLFSLIIAVNIPLVFISIVASICALENVSMLHDLSIKILKRFLWTLFFVAIATIFVNLIFFPVLKFDVGGETSLNNFIEMEKIFDLILSMIPENVVGAFLDKNVLQIVVLAFITGICITILGNRVQGFKDLILDSQKIIFEMMSIVFKIIPAIIFLCTLKISLVNSITEIFSVWKLIAAEYILFIFLSLTFLLKNYFLHGVKILDFLKKIYPAMLIAFTTSSGAAAMPKNIELCEKELKISKNLCEFYIPISHALCPSTMLIGFITCVFFAAEFSGQQITIAQIFIITFLAMQFSVSSSGGNGGMVALLGILLTQLEISLDAIGTIMIADIFVVNVSGIAQLIIRDCDLLAFSKKIK